MADNSLIIINLPKKMDGFGWLRMASEIPRKITSGPSGQVSTDSWSSNVPHIGDSGAYVRTMTNL